jgi:hypothetical protein
LSLVSPANNVQRVGPIANTIGVTRSNGPAQQQTQQSAYNTAPSRSGLLTAANLAMINERERINTYQPPPQTISSIDPVTGPRPGYDEFGTAGASGSEGIHKPHQVNTNQARRFTLVNGESEIEPESPPQAQGQTQAQAQTPASSPKKFLSAYEEKKMMREAMNGSARPDSAGNDAAPSVPSNTQGPSRKGHWLSAEEEKQRLYANAKQQAQRTQAIMGGMMSSMVIELYFMFFDGL